MKKLKAVIDTNILVSALLGSRTCKDIILSFERQAFTLVLTDALVKEIKEVLLDREIGEFSGHDLERLFKVLARQAEVVRPMTSLRLCRDPEDDKILEAALASGADFIVTRDKDLLVLKSLDKTLIIRPEEFIKILQ